MIIFIFECVGMVAVFRKVTFPYSVNLSEIIKKEK